MKFLQIEVPLARATLVAANVAVDENGLDKELLRYMLRPIFDGMSITITDMEGVLLECPIHAEAFGSKEIRIVAPSGERAKLIVHFANSWKTNLRAANVHIELPHAYRISEIASAFSLDAAVMHNEHPAYRKVASGTAFIGHRGTSLWTFTCAVLP